MREVLPRVVGLLPSSILFDAGPRSAGNKGSTPPGNLGPSLALGLAVTCLLVFGGGLWLGLTKIAGAVVAPATVVVEGDTKKVQHPTGGTISGIYAQDGDHVRAGDVLVRLDDTLARANLKIISEDLNRVTVRLARLDAERQGLSKMPIPSGLQADMGNPDVVALVDGERTLLETRTSELTGQKTLLRSQTEQIERQLEGLKAQQAAMDESAALLGRDLTDVDTLYSKKLVSKERLSNVRLDATRAKGESGRLAAAVAEAQVKITETELQVLQLDEQRRSEVTKELRETEANRTELDERKIVAQDELTKTEIRAPQSGTIQQSTVHTIGGVIAPGELLMTIVPDADNLVVDAHVPPSRIDDIRSGQSVSIRFPAFDASTTPACRGNVKWISADQIKDPQHQLSYFSARISVQDRTDCLTDARGLRPGMPAEVHISTGLRSVWSYLVKPLTDQMSHAFR